MKERSLTASILCNDHAELLLFDLVAGEPRQTVILRSAVTKGPDIKSSSPRNSGNCFSILIDYDRLHRAMAVNAVPSARVAVMVHLPLPTALHTPSALTVATLVLLLLQVTVPE